MQCDMPACNGLMQRKQMHQGISAEPGDFCLNSPIIVSR
ncbi:hypothetical protein O59_003117 [Cellvibrio sp. BR]|nr:hypothetical protein O59_003117 [Cellvibrio sp. BR]